MNLNRRAILIAGLAVTVVGVALLVEVTTSGTALHRTAVTGPILQPPLDGLCSAFTLVRFQRATIPVNTPITWLRTGSPTNVFGFILDGEWSGEGDDHNRQASYDVA